MSVFRVRVFIAAVLVTLLASCSVGAANRAEESGHEATLYAVLPHPDDEFQVWSQIENQPDAYKIMVVLTHGEESIYCDAVGGRWSDTCATARLDSWRTFFTRMAQSDASIPGDFGAVNEVDLTDQQPVLERDDDGELVRDPVAQVWLDKSDRGALIAFNSGDGDLTEGETTWAVDLVLNQPDLFGLPDPASDTQAWGAYAYSGSEPGCAQYPNTDHKIVATVLSAHRLEVERQGYSSCSLDESTGAGAPTEVSQVAARAAFGEDGAFPGAYGWLGTWPLSPGEAELFHVQQAFVMGPEVIDALIETLSAHPH